jgi:type I restriction enzyme S subunit
VEVRSGYKLTEVGIIPEEWEVKPLEAVLSLKHGFAFPSEYFAKLGPIVLTPGNFRLDGGLFFEERNTKRYSGSYSPKMTFSRGDLLIVMTDLTPNCNLLGKPAFVQTDEVILHNQRIGKVILKDKSVHLPLLYYFLLSRTYLDHIKAHAFGSTVRHTSNRSIYSARLAWPQTSEQCAIATALSDVDALLDGLERLIAKKRDLKQATMQQLLTGQTRLPGFSGEWEVKRLGEVADIRSGGTPSTTVPQFWDGSIPWCTPTDITALDGRKYLSDTNRMITRQGLKSSSAEMIPAHSIVMTSRATIGECAINTVPISTNQGFKNFVPFDTTDVEFLYYLLTTQKSGFISLCGGSTFLEIGKTQLAVYQVRLPNTKGEQTAIAVVLSDMDAEISALVARRDKTCDLKRAMMQELLTGRTRLV